METPSPGDWSNTSSGPFDPSTDARQSTTPFATHSRVSWLPPLPFQLPRRPRSVLTSSSSLSSLDTPSRPLMRNVTRSISLTSSSFYSRSTLSSNFPLSRQPSTISSASERSRYGPLRDSPRPTMTTPSNPEVPPIPERWKLTAPCPRSIDRPIRPGFRPRLPPAGFWEYTSEQQKCGFPALGSTPSWTDMSDSTKREPSFCRYPILPISPPKSITPDKDKAVSGRPSRRRSYEGLRKGEGDGNNLPSHLNSRWLELDDRRDPKYKKQAAQRRESRTLVKKRQP